MIRESKGVGLSTVFSGINIKERNDLARSQALGIIRPVPVP